MTVDEFIQWFHSTSDDERQDLRSKLEALIYGESERAAGIAARIRDAQSSASHARFVLARCHDEILRTSPGRLDVKYDRAYASPGKRGG